MSIYQFKLPDIGEGVVEAELVGWHVQEGDRVHEDQVLAELMTDKASIEIPSPRAGRVTRRHFAEGEIVPVGAVLVEIEVDGAGGAGGTRDGRTPRAGRAERAEEAERAAKGKAESTPVATAESDVGEKQRPARAAPDARTTAAGEGGKAGTPRVRASSRPPRLPERPGGAARRVRAVPAVREFARRLGVDVEEVDGTGPAGRVMRRDVERHLEASGAERARHRATEESGATIEPFAADEPDWEREPLRGVRRLTAEHMRRSKSTAAHFTYVEEVDMTAVEERRAALAAGGKEVSPLAFVARAVLLELPAYPRLNASLDDARGEIVLKRRIHLGVATATEDGLLVPVIRDADRLGLEEISVAIGALARGARARKLQPAELTGSTFTISSLGKLGGLLATPIINYPETAILSVHAIRRLPRYRGDELVPRAVMNVALSVDHRVADGIDAARFVTNVKRRLEDLGLDAPQEGGEG